MRSYFYIILLLVSFNVAGQQIKISLYNSMPVKGLVMALYKGDYNLYSDDQKIAGFNEGKIFYITLYNNRLLLNNGMNTLGIFDEIYLRPASDSSKIQISSIDPKAATRTFIGNIHLKILYGRILLLNEINVERYISGVVEAESGINALPEFYKAQALLCRTYLYSHLNRHETEGFNLCDEVHCQVYKGNTPFTNTIYNSTVLTADKIIVNQENKLITATFHANCGGETESSLNTWLKSENYLVPVKDPYCKYSNSHSWQKKIPLAQWKKYLNDHGIKTQSVPLTSFEMKKPGRQNFYTVGKSSILTRQIRADWDLRSSYFQVLVKNDHIILNGRGYGHGVGLCQDGAMKMAVNGKNFNQIIDFYFKGVRIEEIKNLSLL